MDQIERITHMEAILDQAEAVATALDLALDRWEELQEGFAELEAYYSGGEWMRDYDDDTAGKIPKDLKRGVLSEDAVYNLLTDWDRLRKRMAELGKA